MYCTNCGELFSENVKFCMSCGSRIGSDILDKENVTYEEISDNEEISFIRHKSLGRLDISHTISKVSISDNKLNVSQQKVTLYWFKKHPIETSHDISTITNIKIKRSIDKSDMIFAIIFILMGFSNPMGFLAGGIFLWVGFGYKVEIRKINGAVIEIPAEFSKECTELVKKIIAVNKSIVVEQ